MSGLLHRHHQLPRVDEAGGLFVVRPEALKLRVDSLVEAVFDPPHCPRKVSQALLRWRDRRVPGKIRLAEILHPDDRASLDLTPSAGRRVAA